MDTLASFQTRVAVDVERVHLNPLFLTGNACALRLCDNGDMNSSETKGQPSDDDCVVPDHPVPPEEIGRYSAERDPDAEQDIANYIHAEARDETVQHVEKVKTEYVMGDPYEIWDVTTDKNRWWVITNLTNLYSQKHFRSLDYTLSFHIGLMMRLRSRPEGADSSDPQPFDEVFRRQEQAKERHDRAIEAEDYQSVGMQLRECLLSLISVMRRRVELHTEIVKTEGRRLQSMGRDLGRPFMPGREKQGASPVPQGDFRKNVAIGQLANS